MLTIREIYFKAEKIVTGKSTGELSKTKITKRKRAESPTKRNIATFMATNMETVFKVGLTATVKNTGKLIKNVVENTSPSEHNITL